MSHRQTDRTDSRLLPRIRPATADDRPRLIELINAAYSIEKFFDGVRIDELQMDTVMEKGRILVAEEDAGGVLATVYVELRGAVGYIGMLAVDPEHQGRGLGRMMIEQAEACLRSQGCETAEMIVLSLRSELFPLYRKLGFAEIRTTPFQTSRPLRPGFECHAIVMSKAL